MVHEHTKLQSMAVGKLLFANLGSRDSCSIRTWQSVEGQSTTLPADSTFDYTQAPERGFV